jgi:hypothetical protein
MNLAVHTAAAPHTRRPARSATAFTWAVWPAGLLLTAAYAEAHLVPLPLFVILDLAYGAAAALAMRRAGAPAAWLIAPAAVIFSLASLTGAPTAREPGAMVANAAVLGVAAGILLIGYVVAAARMWDSPGRGAAAIAVVTISVGTAVYLINLLARFAVVLSGAAPAHAAVEDRAWQAYAYLLGLDGEPSPLTLLLVWLDLLQFAYVVLAYLSAATLGVAVYRGCVLTRNRMRAVAAAGVLLAAAALAGGVLGSTSAGLGPTGAGVAFAATIPFMTTLLPSMLGAAIRHRRPQS